MSVKKPIEIAARMKAEPGWRVVVIAEEEAGLMARIHKVEWWGVPAPEATLPKPALAPIMALFGSLGGDMFGIPSPKIVPINADGAQLFPRWIVPPCEKSDEDIIGEVQAWAAEVERLNPPASSRGVAEVKW
jgi:hypothetical protein